jgi:hypothetical protein
MPPCSCLERDPQLIHKLPIHNHHFGRSKPTEQNQDQQDNDYEAKAAATVVAGPIEWTASKPTKTSEQD